jgi:6-phosphogluconate dehydrogenase
MTQPSTQANFGLVGLAVMGQNLVLNLSDHGFRVSVFNRTIERTEALAASFS